MFDPELAGRRLGIFTILKEIEFARETGRQFYYLGYCYEGNSFYDYKKQFRGTESYDWKAGWKTFVPMPAETQNFDGHRSSNSRSANNVVIRHDHGRGRRRR